ncbi:hypothetical protein [Echinimonas agarilytica]|uniref:Uncharacterized protein n=1 Tax=Echinimonas agarilytica TaxID=1215918 RepID=A0AA42B7D5_9GAMM|nr:hypothetical protein [Echinimonas agarilytica]MCM2679810.1 hypothetical protein [Echinimonas agarilytica]
MIALQSWFAVASTYEPHQSGLKHYQTSHSHKHAADADAPFGHGDSDSHLASTDIPANDCHQCGHCHGHASAALVVFNASASFVPSAEAPLDFLSSKTNYLPISLFRPPIA